MAVEKFYGQTDVFLSEEEDTVISTEYLFIKKGKALKKVYLSDIIYIEVEEKYCNIITEKEKFIILISLTKILELLNHVGFSRTHRNYIVNTEKIIPGDNLILLSGNHKATLSDTYKNIIKRVRTLKINWSVLKILKNYVFLLFVAYYNFVPYRFRYSEV